MTTKITDDMIKGQWKKQNISHDAQWNAIVHIGEELGVQFDENGDVVGRTQKTQSVAPSVPSTPPVISVSNEQLNEAVSMAIKANPPKVIVQQPQVATNQPSLTSVNNKVIDALAEKWDPIIDGYCGKIMETYGAATKLNDEQPVFEEKTVRQIKKLHAYVGKCLRWFIQDFLSKPRKAVAYEIAICCALFGAYQYYHNRQLLTQSKKDAVIRYVLSGDPSNKAMIEKIDTLLNEKGVDAIIENVKHN